ncbi:50S ribosomal protein L25 [candidate division WWE3 bacterium CG_4_9_14_3_um_filter_41_6]|uniref:Large ribosomal subunit protein bL25 n=1 Tax=candidate division WWE3 bacterium CG_4_10_14_0_2_um_filter_41_14 TaxID=1975072 RepID=A0A2M7TEJ9_UNCKA|nr:MAG: 50S ribosomal protein L25 [candidate division WWE3 bacterium CG_4_10_14_0_2_um_filter_41_14]PJA37917.1 MAG: 50S ribosomal protein L25 [candidate division WWE3 bacterium CG_4_9_14_3_um_filter_41_6]
MADIEITVQKRTALKKQVNALRNEGFLPANIYGPLVEASLAVQMEKSVFKDLYQKSGKSDLVTLTVEGETETRPVLLYGVQRDPVSDEVIHVDLYQVDLTKKIDVEIPINLFGEAPAVTNKLGELLQLLDSLKVRVLPTNIPRAFELSLESLEQVGDALTIGDLTMPDGVEVLDIQPEELIVKVDAIVEVTAEDLATPEETEALAQKVADDAEEKEAGENKPSDAETASE